MTVEQLAKRLNADLNGNSNHFKRKITSIAPIKSANECNITFLTDDKHKTAITLQIGLATLYRKIKEYSLE